MRASFETVKNLKQSPGSVLLKKLHLKIFQNSEETTCAWVSFLIKLQAGGLQLYQMQAPVQVFPCEFFEIFNNTSFEEHLLTTASKKLTTTSFYVFFS